jgi:mono/diheme cytochrome c family protein
VSRKGLPAAVFAAAALALLPAATGRSVVRAAAPGVDFNRQILPIFQRACVSCHGPDKANGGLQLGSARRLARAGISDELLVPGHAGQSYLVKRLRGEGGEDRMPLKQKPLAPAELALIERWVDEGAVLPDDPPPRFVPAPGGLKRLSVAQYHNTLRDLLGPAVPLPTELEPDTLVAGSAVVGAARVSLSAHGVEKYGAAAFALAAAALRDPAFRARHLPCTGTVDAACARGFIEKLGLRAFRRPLRADERERYLRLFGATGGEPALVAVTAALLQSPNFLYRAEIGIPDPADPTRRRLTDFELASRLSYFLWSAPPDDELMAATLAGQLSSDEGLAAQTRRMMRSPRTHATMSAFFLELFRLRRLDKIYESRAKYPQFTLTVGDSMKGETLRLIEEIAFSPTRDFREIFSADFTFVNPELARLYKLPGAQLSEHEGDGPGDYRKVALPPGSARRGVLAQGSFLTIFAHPSSSSPTKRGKFIRETLLCQAVPPPPPSVDTKLPKDEGKQKRTTRQKLEAHRKDVRCNGCHKSMDPLGLAFEHFDGIGAERADEAGLPIDTSGELDGTPFKDAAGLGALLARSPKLGACVARSLFRFAVGHLESEGEEPLMEALAQGLARDGYRFEALVENVIKSEGFRTIAAPSFVARPHDRPVAQSDDD